MRGLNQDYTYVFLKVSTIRKKQSLTQEDLALRMGYSRSLVARIESGDVKNPSEYLNLLIEALGDDMVNAFPFDISQFTNHRLLAYMALFGEDIRSTAQALDINRQKLKRFILSERKEYLFGYIEKIEALFPEREKYTYLYDSFKIVGNNSVSFRSEGEEKIFVNVIGLKKRDTIVDILESTKIRQCM